MGTDWRAGLVAGALQQQPQRHSGGPRQVPELHQRAVTRLPSGQVRPESALGVVNVRCDVQAELVDAAD
jgi:hypothetical protein